MDPETESPTLLARAEAARTAGRLDEAEALLTTFAGRHPFEPAFGCALGRLRLDQAQPWEAIEVFRRTLELDRSHLPSRLGLVESMLALGQIDEADVALRQILAVAPDNAEAELTLASLMRARLRYDEAARHFARAAHLFGPGHERATFARLMRAMSLLAIGDWAEGWTDYELRMRTTVLSQAGMIAQHWQRWSGEVDPESRLLIWWEQGLGDSLQFVRYLKYPLCLGFKVILHVQEPLVRLMKISFGDYVQVVSGFTFPPGRWHCPLLSLPLALRPHLGDTIPADVPYLSAEPAAIDSVTRRLEGLAPGRRRLGLAWRGNPNNPNDGLRSVDAGLIAALLELDADFFVIQPGESIAPFTALGYRNIHDLTDGIDDFADTAAALCALDGLISVDTSVAHLAGALGRPVWMPLPRVPDWRWGVASGRTVWYPYMRLFRQTRDRDWSTPLIALGADLAQWLATHPMPR